MQEKQPFSIQNDPLIQSAGLPTPKEFSLLNTLLFAIPTTTPLNSLLQTPLQVPLPLHISLSAPLILHTTTKDSFLSTLTTRLEPHLQRLRSPITVSPSSISWHSNEDGSRYFLVLELRDVEGYDGALATLSKLLATSNDVAAAYGQPRLYTRKDKDTAKKAKDDPSSSFHISIAWTLPSSDRNLEDENAKLKTPEVEKLMENVSEMVVSFDAVKVRIGQTVTALKVSGSGSVEGRRGLFG